MNSLDLMRKVFFLLVFCMFLGYTGWEFFNYNPRPLAVNISPKYTPITIDPSWVKTGDLVLRRGKGFISEMAREFCRQDPSFSHSGIIKEEEGRLWVYHALGGEARQSNKMQKEPIELFLHPQICFDFAFYRYTLSESEQMKFDSVLTAYYQAGIEFDLDFDYLTDDQMYCSELIAKALVNATENKNFIPLSMVVDKPYVAIDNLYLNPFCTFICQHKYE